MKLLICTFTFFMSSFLISGPTMRLETNDGYFMEATLLDNSRLMAFSKNATNCTGTYLKDMVSKRMMVVFDAQCISENLTVYFTEQAYISLYQGKQVDVEVEMSQFPNQKKTAIARIVSQ